VTSLAQIGDNLKLVIHQISTSSHNFITEKYAQEVGRYQITSKTRIMLTKNIAHFSYLVCSVLYNF